MRKLYSICTWLMLVLVTLAMATPAMADDFNSTRTDFRDETIYFAMTTRFYDGDEWNNVLCWDNQQCQEQTKDPCWRGDFAGLIEKLDYIKALGFTAIWITPIVQNASGYDYHGYHAMDFSKVDLRYESHTSWGSSKDVTFQSLIDAAHAKGLKIILDVVFNHTGNFGENYLCKIFERNPKIRNQATPEASLTPSSVLGGADYWKLPGTTQYQKRLALMKNTDGQNHDTHNYWHHVATSWNWDEPSRWWGQIAGDCVDLNTENPAVTDYLVECYGQFIKMGVDGFRVDTSGHISRLSFNKSLIPQLNALGEQYKSRRLNNCPFYMFGEVCARFGGVTYRDQPNLSPYYYTWASPSNLLGQWNNDASWWDQQYVREGADPLGNMLLCLQEPSTKQTSTNAFLENGQYHTPDYSQASKFYVIDFPLHYNFTNAGSAVGLAKDGDKYYNDATYNVVYVDSHDYGPQPNDRVRFAGGTSQWAENLSLMFTFRGIPCIYYGSEVEFQAGQVIDDGPNGPLSNTGRAYFGEYLKGTVTATDFGQYTASGNVQQTLNYDLAQHIRRLNLIRQAVPALRKGQYSFDGCQGSIAFKRAYGNSYALVAINGGATFTGVPNGTYTDLVTGQKYSGSTITVSAPSNQGQLRVLVKDWNGGKVGEDGKFIYASSPVSHGGKPSFSDSGASRWWKPSDATAGASVTLNPNGGSFKTETQTVTATLNEEAVSGWYQIGNGSKVNLTKGTPATFTIGSGMSYGQTVTVKWGATNSEGDSYTGEATYKKVDPNATITIYCKANSAPNLYAWSGETALNGAWPGTKMSATTTVGGQTFYYVTFSDVESINVIFNNGQGAQTGDITGITEDTYFQYDGGTTATDITSQVDVTPTASVKFNPNGGQFYTETQTVTATLNSDAKSGWYKIGNGSQVSLTPGQAKSFTIGEGMSIGDKVTVSWSGTASDNKVYTGSVTFERAEKPSGITVYIKCNTSPYLYAWKGESTDLNGKWPGGKLTETTTVKGQTFYYKNFQEQSINIVINNGNGGQTADITNITKDVYYDYNGSTVASDVTSTYGEGGTGGGGGDDPQPTNLIHAYFVNTPSWSTVMCWAWDANNDNRNYTGGTWPGANCTKLNIKGDNGEDIWEWKYTGNLTTMPTHIIFNNGGNNDQTADLTFSNGGVYNKNGACAVPNSLSGIDYVNMLTIQPYIVYDLRGMKVTTVYSMEEAFSTLPRGIYVVNGKKIAVR